jgi:UPF0755 protein
MKNKILIGAALLLIAGLIFSRSYFTSNTAFEKKVFLYLPTGSSFQNLNDLLVKNNIVKDINSFAKIAEQLNLPSHVHPGKYEFTEGMSNYTMVKMLRAGNQKPVQLVMNRYRTKRDVIHKICSSLEADSTELNKLLNDNNYLALWNLDSSNVIGAFTPNTYEFYWNTNAKTVFEKISKAYQKFWNGANINKANAKKLTPIQVMTLASIVDEETNYKPEKGIIASVYLNRLNKGMKLQADPTVKYAIGDFAIRRILNAQLNFASPYNTYYVTGLPPGPICTPKQESIEAVLNAPETEYIFFCAKEDFSGSHNFAVTLAEHEINAKKFQAAMNARGIRK